MIVAKSGLLGQWGVGGVRQALIVSMTDYQMRRLRNRIESLAAIVCDQGKTVSQEILQTQERIFELQVDLQNAITSSKKEVGREKAGHDQLRTLKIYRWFARQLGNAVAWYLLLYNRQHIDALSHNSPTSIPLTRETDGTRGTWAAATGNAGPVWGLPIVHDITDCLRVGDVTFLAFDGSPDRPVHRTYEVKTTRISDTPNADGSHTLDLKVTLIGEPIPLLPSPDPTPQDVSIGDRPRRASWEDDPRTKRQLNRMDVALARRDARDDRLEVIGGVNHITMRAEGTDQHHWAELRRAIRAAHKDGHGYFSIDQYVSYAVFYKKEGIDTDFLQEHMDSSRVLSLLQPGAKNNHVTVIQLPTNDGATESPTMMPFYLWQVPVRAIRELIRNQLNIVCFLNYGRVESALEAAGFETYRPANVKDTRLFRMKATLKWSTGEALEFDAPPPTRDIHEAVMEFQGLESIVAKSTVMFRIPELIEIDDFQKAWESERDNRERRASDAPLRPRRQPMR